MRCRVTLLPIFVVLSSPFSFFPECGTRFRLQRRKSYSPVTTEVQQFVSGTAHVRLRPARPSSKDYVADGCLRFAELTRTPAAVPSADPLLASRSRMLHDGKNKYPPHNCNFSGLGVIYSPYNSSQVIRHPF